MAEKAQIDLSYDFLHRYSHHLHHFRIGRTISMSYYEKTAQNTAARLLYSQTIEIPCNGICNRP